MRKLIFLLLIFWLSACKFYMPEYRGGESIKDVQVEKRTLAFTIGTTLYNPNNYNLKVKPSVVDVYLNDLYIGEAKLTSTIRLKAKQESTVFAPIEVELEKGVMLKAAFLFAQGSVKLKTKGQVKAGSFLYIRKVDADFEKTVGPELFKR